MRAKLTINVYMTKFLVTLLLKKAFFVIYPLFSMPPIKHKNRAGHLRHEETPRSGFYFTFPIKRRKGQSLLSELQ